MTYDLLTTFRSEMPLPDEATAQRIYRRATSGRRHVVTRRRLVAAVAALAAAGIAGGLSATLGGGASKTPTGPGPGGGGPATGMSLNPLSVDFAASGHEFTSIDVSVLSPTAETTLRLRVVRSDAAQVSEADSAPSEVVFDEQVSMTVVESDVQDATHSTWSGRLTPSEWTGGCQQALYRIEYDFGTDDSSGSSGWFQCKGPAADAANPFLY